MYQHLIKHFSAITLETRHSVDAYIGGLTVKTLDTSGMTMFLYGCLIYMAFYLTDFRYMSSNFLII